MIPFRKKIRKSVPKKFTFCVQISRKSAGGKWVKRCVALVTKRSENAFCTRLADCTKSLQESVPPEPTSLCKISSQLVPVCRRSFRKSEFILKMGIEPNNEGSGSVRFGHCSGSGSVKVQVIRGLQLRIWFGHNCNCKKLDALKKSNPTHVYKNQTNHTDSATRQ